MCPQSNEPGVYQCPQMNWESSHFHRYAVAYGFLATWSVMIIAIISRGLAGDLWWDLAAGRWEVLHHAVLRVNPFGFGRAVDFPWVNTEWAWGIIVWVAAQWNGYLGLVCVSAVGAGVFLAGVWLFAKQTGAGRLFTLGMLGFAGLSSLPWWSFRPQVWAYGAAIWSLIGLVATLRAVESHQWKRAALGSVGLEIGVWAWAQFHGSWILFPVWAALLGFRFGRRTTWAYGLGLGGMSILSVGILNPWHGLAYILAAVHTVGNTEIAAYIGEWTSPSFRGGYMPLVYGIYLVAGLMLTRRARPGWGWVWYGGFLAAALYAIRFDPYLVCGLMGLRWGLEPEPERPSFIAGLGITASALAAVVGLIVAITPIQRSLTLNVQPALDPVGALPILRREDPSGRVFNSLRYGGFLEYFGLRPWIDGRDGFYTTVGRFSPYVQAKEGFINPVTLVDRTQVQWALVERNEPFAWNLQAAGWHVRWQNVACVLLEAPRSWVSKGR